MPVQKILAYFMHEKEEAVVASVLTNPQRTESYFIGEADDAEVQKLRDQNIVVQVLGKSPDAVDEQIGVRKMNRINGITNIRMLNADAVVQEAVQAGFPAYYKISIDGPLLDEYRSRLQQAKVEIIEFLPPDLYVVRVPTEDAYYSLTGMLFVNNVDFYSSKDTGVNVQKQTPTALPPEVTEKQILPFDIFLHREEDLPQMLQWLDEKRVAVAGSGGKKIRVYLLEDAPLQNEIAAHTLVQSFDQFVPPKLHNDIARQILGLDALAAPVGSSVTYTGDGEIVGVADTGIDDAHPDFQNQLHQKPVALGRVNDYSDFNGHGTHVAGSIVGNGTASAGAIKGTAPGAKVFFQSIMDANGDLRLPLQLQTLFQQAYNAGVRIHNNSWGSATSSRYTVNAVEVDDFVAKNRDMLLVFSAGNDGNAFSPVNVPTGYPDFLSIGSPGSAKNVLTVGASRSKRTAGGYAAFSYGTVWPQFFPNPPLNAEKVSGDANALACFSSRGPCDDNRIKPDVVAPGTDIASVKSSKAAISNFWGIMPGNPQYAIMGGTSMASPISAGCAAVVREYYRKERGHVPSAALLKATIINGCKKLTGQDCVVKFPNLPNYNQGFGMIDMTNTIPNASNPFFLHFQDNYNSPADQFRRTGQRIRMQITLATDTWMRICMAYTDVPGRALQNNLNLLLDFNATGKKWIGNEMAPAVLKAPDPTNNVETIVIENASTGDYTLQITATNIIKSPQDFAFVITTGDGQTIIQPKP